MIKQMSIMITNHFLTIDGLKGYFEEHDDEKKIQYLDLKKINI